MSITAPAQRTPLSEPVRQMPREPDNPLADDSQSLLSPFPKSAPAKPWRPPGAADSAGGSPGVTRSASAGALRERQASSRDRGGRDRRMQRSASCANSEGQQLRRAPAFRNLPVPESQISMRPDVRERRTRDSRDDKEELQVSPQSRATATTATSAAPSSYWGLGTPSSRNGHRQEMRPLPEPSSPCQDFLYLSET